MLMMMMMMMMVEARAPPSDAPCCPIPSRSGGMLSLGLMGPSVHRFLRLELINRTELPGPASHHFPGPCPHPPSHPREPQRRRQGGGGRSGAVPKGTRWRGPVQVVARGGFDLEEAKFVRRFGRFSSPVQGDPPEKGRSSEETWQPNRRTEESGRDKRPHSFFPVEPLVSRAAPRGCPVAEAGDGAPREAFGTRNLAARPRFSTSLPRERSDRG